MAWSTQRTTGRPGSYKLDRGGTPVESGPFIGIVKNNNDPIRAGRVQVWIEEFGNGNPDDDTTWRTVSYISPFYGTTEQFGTDTGTGSFIGNKQSYGFWFTPPDIGTELICFFASGDPNQGFYLGSAIKPGINHMLPAIGASRKFKLDNSPQSEYFQRAGRLPVTEINDENQAIDENPRFYDEPNLMHWKLRAQANMQRHYEIYLIEVEDEITVEDITAAFEDAPQQMADTVRRIGHCFYSDRMREKARIV